jgi:hypothetical protein
LAAAEQTAIEQGIITAGDLLVFIGGLRLPFAGQSNLLRVQIAGTPQEPPDDGALTPGSPPAT